MNTILLLVLLFNADFTANSILQYDSRVRLLNITDDEKYKYLFNKSLIDEVKIQIEVADSRIVGATWLDYYTGKTQMSNIFPIPDGLYTILSRSVIQRCYTNELILSAIQGVKCTCACSSEVVVKEVVVHTISYQDFNWVWTGLGFTFGVGLGVGLGWLIFN